METRYVRRCCRPTLRRSGAACQDCGGVDARPMGDPPTRGLRPQGDRGGDSTGMTWVLLLYLCLGSYLVWWLPPNESEQHHFGLGNRDQMAIDHFLNFGVPLPARLPWRLQAEYWLYGWTTDITVARLAALIISGFGVGLTMEYAAALGGPTAGVV